MFKLETPIIRQCYAHEQNSEQWKYLFSSLTSANSQTWLQIGGKSQRVGSIFQKFDNDPHII